VENIERSIRGVTTGAGDVPSEGTVSTTQGDERRRSLIQATYQLIAEGGLEQLRTRTIAARAAVNIATLHYYFARKEDLIQGVVEYLLQQFKIAYLPEFPAQMRTPLERIHGELLEQEYLLQEQPELFIVFNELVLRSRHDPAIHQMLTRLDEHWHTYLEQILREGREQGVFHAALDPASAATWLILLLKGTALHALTSPQAVDFDHLWADIECWLTGQRSA